MRSELTDSFILALFPLQRGDDFVKATPPPFVIPEQEEKEILKTKLLQQNNELQFHSWYKYGLQYRKK